MESLMNLPFFVDEHVLQESHSKCYQPWWNREGTDCNAKLWISYSTLECTKKSAKEVSY